MACVFNGQWKSEIVQRAPIFLVPTGNPMDDEQHLQFRLSFSMVEIACFEQISPPMRKMFGIVKYLFKAMFSGSNLLSSYHVKTLMLWKIDQIPLDDWETMKITDFIKVMMNEIGQTLRTANIPHTSLLRIVTSSRFTKSQNKMYLNTSPFSKICQNG